MEESRWYIDQQINTFHEAAVQAIEKSKAWCDKQGALSAGRWWSEGELLWYVRSSADI